jgi:hypothetical protein
MINTQHTPAPWLLAGFTIVNPNASLRKDRHDMKGGAIAEVSGWGNATPEQQKANAILIAAAPELLRFVERYLSTQPGDTYKGYISNYHLKAEAEALYAKATAHGEA